MTKNKQFYDTIKKHLEKKERETIIKNLMYGFELSNRMILEYINKGKTIEELKLFVEKNLKDGKNIIEKNMK